MVGLLKCVCVILIVQLNFLQIHSISGGVQTNRKFFRKDYTYLEATEAFYKYQTVAKTWTQAREKCEAEGATLFYPWDEQEFIAVAGFWNSTQPHPSIFVGISDVLVKEVFVTVDGKSIYDIYNKWGTGEPQGVEHCVILNRDDGTLQEHGCNLKKHFICKKSLAELEWNKDCDMPRMDYVYNPTLGRCYKVHTDLKNWSDAVATCYAEDAYLAILNSKLEADYLSLMARKARKPNTPDWIHMGFHRFGGSWMTIKAQFLESTGYTTWSPTQPDDAGGTEFCGSMIFDGGLNDLTCSIRCYYICEREIESQQSDVDERFNDLLFNFDSKQ